MKLEKFSGLNIRTPKLEVLLKQISSSGAGKKIQLAYLWLKK
jgi:hypothetical protein